MPTLSIIIPAYNAAAFIDETLESVFAQTFSDFEVILVNDGSSDGPELERVIAPYRNRILYLDQDNLGPAGARNTGIRHARGKYLAFLEGGAVTALSFSPPASANAGGGGVAKPSLDDRAGARAIPFEAE